MPGKIELKQQLKALYTASAVKPHLVEVPPLQYLMIDGAGDPSTSQAYRDAMEALYGLAYTLKFRVKKGPEAMDFVVMPLEGLWWADDMGAFLAGDRATWQWTSMILQPDAVSPEMVEAARAELHRKKDVPALDSVRLEMYVEGLSAQVMHIGPYAAEAPTIEGLHAFIEESGYVRRSRHHEIYVGDPRRTAPEKLKTIIRQPVARP